MSKQWTGYMDGYLKTNLDRANVVIKKDWDMVFIIDGYEGSGKSVLAQQCSKYVDPSFNIERICFTPDEFVSCINKAEKFTAIIYDEAYGGMGSRAAMSEVNKMLMGVLAEIRQKNLWVFIILPCFFELDKYAAIWRSRALLHVYTNDFERGRFAFYSQDKKKSLYVNGKKFYSYHRPKCNFFGRFTDGYTVNVDEYKQKKLDALKSRENKEETEESTSLRRHRTLAGRCLKFIKETHKLTLPKMGKMFDEEEKQISRLIIRAKSLEKPVSDGDGQPIVRDTYQVSPEGGETSTKTE